MNPSSGPYTPEVKFNRHMPMQIVKQEFHEPSPPPYLRPRSISPMPDVIPGNEKYDIASYRQFQVANFKPSANNDINVRKLLFDLIKERPHMWEKAKTKVSINEWEKLGLEIWQRLDIVASIEQMRQTWRIAKDGLRRRIRTAIETHSYNPNETEAYLHNWDVYNHFRYFRKRYEVYEQELRKVHAGELANAAAIREAEEGDDEIIFDGFHSGDGAGASNDGIPDAPYVEYSTDTLPHPRNAASNSFLEEAQRLLMSNNPVVESSSSSAYNETISSKLDIKSRKRPAEAMSDSEMSAEHLSHEILRKYRQYPEKETLIRNSIQTLLMAFDDPEGNFQSMADVFGDIAAQEEAKASIRSRRLARQ